MKVIRFDYAAHLVIGERLDAPTPTQASAIRTPEGYLIADAYLARDGLLRYSDGERTWTEYRPREELEALVGTTNAAYGPVTDDHPAEMVTAKSWRSLARGHLLSAPVVEEVDGVGYLRAKVLVADEDLLGKVDAGKRQFSFGFRTEVVPLPNRTAADGTEADALQTKLELNHYAVVDRGRSGPEVKFLMDGSAWLVPEIDMKVKSKKADELGAPVDQVELMGPDGMPVLVPTWIAAQLEQFKAMQQQQAPAAPAMAPPMQPQPAAMQPPMDAPQEEKPMPPAPPAAPGAPAAPPAGPPAAPPKEEEDENKMTKDSVMALVRRRARLERLAASAGVDKFDADDTELSKLFIAKRMPHVAGRLDGMNADQLAALVDAAASMPAATPMVMPWNVAPAGAAEKKDEADEAVIKFLEGQGY